MRISVLVVDDEKASHELIRRVLAPWREGDARLVHVHSAAEAEAAFTRESFHLALIDLHYQGAPDGFPLLLRLRELDPGTELIVVSSAGDFGAVQGAMRAGASDYVAKGFGREELVHALERGLERRRWRRMELRRGGGFEMAGGSPAMEKMKSELGRVAAKDIPVLLEGETGAGKEVAARALHAWGRDSAGPFVAVNCAAIPAGTADSFFFGHEKGAFTGADRAAEGAFEEADGGTLFLDEINSLPPDLQGRLLRVLQEKEVRRVGGNKVRPVSFRLVSAANQSLRRLVAEGSFREDLYYRVGVLPIRVPPLRERREDLDALALFFLPHRRIAGPLRELFRTHSWPGNVREYRNLLLAADALAEADEDLNIEHLPEHALRALAPREETVAAFAATQEEREREFLQRAYRSCGGNVSALARMLGADRSHLHQKLGRLGIHAVRR